MRKREKYSGENRTITSAVYIHLKRRNMSKYLHTLDVIQSHKLQYVIVN